MEILNAAGLKGRIMLFLYRRFYAGADAVIAVSREAASDLTERLRLSPGQVRMIYNPVITPALFEQAKEAVEHPWFAPGQPPVVLSAGRLCEQKDFPTLLRAFAQVRAHTRSRLVILGEGPERLSLERMASDLGLRASVLLPGFVANPYAYMARAATYVLSSKWEGLPTVLIEALACGAPVVSTDCPSGPREILQDGKYGRLVPVGDADALAQAIEANLYDGKGNAPPENWSAFHTEQAAAEYEKVLLTG